MVGNAGMKTLLYWNAFPRNQLLKAARPVMQLSQVAARNWEHSLDAHLGNNLKVSVDLHSTDFVSLSSNEEHITEENVASLWAQTYSDVKHQRHQDTLLRKGVWSNKIFFLPESSWWLYWAGGTVHHLWQAVDVIEGQRAQDCIDLSAAGPALHTAHFEVAPYECCIICLTNAVQVFKGLNNIMAHKSTKG